MCNHREGKKNIILVGFGGHAKSVADSIERAGIYHIVGYTDSEPKKTDYEYLGTDDVLPQYLDQGIHSLHISLGYMGKGNIRELLHKRFQGMGFVFPTIIDPSAVISASAKIGEGSFVGKNAVINADAVVGNMCIINTGSIIEHECKIGDYSHVAVGAILCGQVQTGNRVFVGAGASVIQCISLGEGSLIGAGSVVTKTVLPGVVVAGNPAREICNE